MGILESLERGWYSGWAELPELGAGGVGLLERLIPGRQRGLTEVEENLNEAAERWRRMGPEGEPTGILEKIAEGIGAAPGTLASMAPFIGAATVGAPATAGAAIGSAALGFGLHGLVRHGDEGLRQAVGHGLKGAAEGAIFSGAGAWASKYAPAAARGLMKKQAGLATAAEKEAMQPLIEAALNSPKAQIARRLRHAGAAAAPVGGMGLIHGQSPEDAAASAATMGILGLVGGVTPRQIAEAGKYRDPFITVKKELDKLEGEVAANYERMLERKKAEATTKPTEKPELLGFGRTYESATPPADLLGAGIQSRQLGKETQAMRERVADIEPKLVFEKVHEVYKDQVVPSNMRSDFETTRRAVEKIVKKEDGKIDFAPEHLDSAAKYLLDEMSYLESKVSTIESKMREASKAGNESAVSSLQAELDAALFDHGNTFLQLKGVRSTAGNTMRTLRRSTPGTKDWIEASEKLKSTLGVNADRMSEMLRMSRDNPELMQKLIKAVDTPTMWDQFQEYWINGLLSGPPTQMVNLYSNFLRGAVDVAEKAATLEYGRFVGFKQFNEKTGQYERVKLDPEYVRGELAADLSAGFHAIKLANKVLFGKAKDERFDPASLAPRLAVHSQRSKLDYPTQAIPGKAGEIIRTPGRLLQAMDLYFKTIHGERAAASKAFDMAWKEFKAGELSREGIQQRMLEFRGVKEGFQAHPEILKEMKRVGQQLTFTETLPKWTAPIEKVRQVEFGEAGVRPLVGVVPFFATPFNVIKQALQRSPLGLARIPSLKKAYEAGKLTPREYYNELAATTMGTAVTAGLFGLAKAGFITGGGPVNPQDLQNKIATGWRPYSLHIPGFGYIPLQRIEPLGTILGMAGDAVEIPGSDDRFGKVVATVKDNITDKSFLYGLESLSKAWSNPEMFASTWYRQMSGSLVPNIVAKAQQAIDPYARDVETLGAEIGVPDPIAYRIPGLSSGLPQRQTPFGEPVERWSAAATEDPFSKAMSGLQSFGSPAPVSLERPGREVEQEFDRLSKFPGMPPSTPRRKKQIVLRGVNAEDVKLTNEDYEVYDRYHEQAKLQLEGIISSPGYQRLPDPQKAKLLKSVYQRYRDAANREINARILRRTSVGD